jgi:tripartite-type tricarboxylate transporter receptor subunit TctC
MLFAPAMVSAQPYPSRDIHFILAFPPGSGSDTTVRFLAEKMRPLVSATIVVENKPGASGVLAAEYVARSKPDGYTIFVHAGNTMASIKHLYKKPPFEPAEAMQVAATINKQAFMIVVDAKSPYHTLGDLTAALKAKGEKATYGASANIALILGAMYRELAGLKAVDVTYRSGPDTLNDLASGTLDFAVHDPILALAQAQQGRVRILGVGSKERLQSAPELPTMAEQGVPVDLQSWFAALVPAATPKPIVNQINAWFNQVVATDEARVFLNKFGTDPWISTPEEGQAQMMRDLEKWPDYIRVAKLQPLG